MSDHLYEIFNYVISYYSETETIIVFQCDITCSDPTQYLHSLDQRAPKTTSPVYEAECCPVCSNVLSWNKSIVGVTSDLCPDHY